MGVKALLDTNAVIYLQKGLLLEDLPIGEYAISVITEMELLSFAGLTEDQRTWLRRFINDLDIIGIDGDVKRRAIRLRLARCLKLPDAIIAATAISRSAVLFSNDRGFADIPELDLRKLPLCQSNPPGNAK
ncbi:type II toxin-antitoxin system VapC family toxin [Candidatus Thiosymbion oneisti]|uniref:type II toxin-antitoxin system VapC family toxin n=1 Tax=Candidatus Thiosymbion oneisti TaxID=589554 RepID=UPI0010615B41|nr:type II toxin-antitoxin system VapC family toxin [Candidatus Thiosymbion oneisti]